MIVMKNINKVYADGYQALKNINLEFKQGELTVLIGPSGCGKSTTMKMINHLVTPTSGSILINGRDTREIDTVELRRDIGYVIQSIGLFPHMTIGRNVGVVPRLKKWKADRIERRVDELLKLVGLDPDTYRDRYPSELSGGQQQRIGVIRAFAADPDIILMDEPFSALDPISREQLQDEIVRLQQELHKTIIFVTHDMDEALKIADRIVLMKSGEVVQSDTPERILRHPANEFVASFIGQKRLHQEDLLYDSPTVNEVMVNQPVTAYPNKGLAEAITIMERRKVDTLFIIDRQRQLKGIVSIYNVLEHYGDENITVADVMKPVRYFIRSGSLLSEPVEMMSHNQLSHVAVIDDQDRLVGLVTRGSIVRHLAEILPTSEEAV
ncbi:ABC transporter ATP-binding protein [Paenibacillus sacheonensis]|uniref:Quaternary amine transport ATP-binding protein n=1 Tax=Paenibacillus sacheonensis TaxID=742054 RepID=A0A7X5BVU0_9BACL|nr:betaine/proline/choline family ABC transporter ATP-binding protein [Paenibacillus sacheonensis]MBM7565983.1 osmoprotectant transport system ATP-binding protein [Paenibacillus sacheonensis]NBC68703.1 betaine/proline/choline family ABC transporter ATP-binding protein [Paenibacillus sacheonensis]